MTTAFFINKNLCTIEGFNWGEKSLKYRLHFYLLLFTAFLMLN